MSDRMLGKMSKYMSEYMTWNARVGITRSKLFFTLFSNKAKISNQSPTCSRLHTVHLRAQLVCAILKCWQQVIVSLRLLQVKAEKTFGPFGDALYNPLMVLLRMVYYWVYHITVDQLLYDHYTTFINLIYRCFLKRGTPKSSIFIRFSIIKHPFGGTTIYGNLQIHTHTTCSMRSEYRRFTFNPGQLIRLSWGIQFAGLRQTVYKGNGCFLRWEGPQNHRF